MKTMREMNRLLMHAIRNIMTEEQLDATLNDGMTTRELMAESALVYTQISPDADALAARPAAEASQIKAYWHPKGLICPYKPNAEWISLGLIE